MVSPIFYLLVVSKDTSLASLAFPLFLIGAISDYFDGWYARKYKVISKLGAFIDPLADKFLILSAFVAFNYLGIIPIWTTVVITIRDFSTTFLRLFGDSHHLPVITKRSAKAKTVLQFIFIGYIGLIFYLVKSDSTPYTEQLLDFIYSDFTYYFMLILTIFTVYTLYEYIRDNQKLVSKLFGVEQS